MRLPPNWAPETAALLSSLSSRCGSLGIYGGVGDFAGRIGEPSGGYRDLSRFGGGYSGGEISSVEANDGSDDGSGDGSPARRFEPRQLCSLCLLCLINILERSVFYFFSVDTATDFTVDANVTSAACNLFDTREAKAIDPRSLIEFNSKYFVNGFGFLLPVLGGIIADACIGCKWTLVVGSCLYLTSSSIFYLMLRLPVCHESLQLASLVLMSGAVGFCKPAVAVLTAANCRPSLSFAVTFLLYYLCSGVGECLGCTLSFAESQSQVPLFAYCVAATAAMLAMALLVQDRRSVEPFDTPSKRRMVLHFSQSSTFIACITISLTSFYLYGEELSSYLGCVTRLDEQIRFSQLWIVYSLALCATCLLQLCGLPCCRWLRPPELRVRLGLVLYALSQVVAFGINLNSDKILQLARHNRSELFAIVSVPTSLTAAAEALTIAAGYELTYRSARLGCKAFITGVYITVWGLGFFFMGLLVLLLTRVPANWPLLSPDRPGTGPQVQWAYLVLAGLLLLNLGAFECGCRPVAGAIICEDDADAASHFEPVGGGSWGPEWWRLRRRQRRRQRPGDGSIQAANADC